MSLEHAVAQLRHLYAQMNQGIVLDSRRAAQGILGPAIEEIERFQRGEAPPSAETRPDSLQAGVCDVCKIQSAWKGAHCYRAPWCTAPAASETERAPAPKVQRREDTPETKAFWESAERTGAVVETWPAWKRAGINVATERAPAEAPSEPIRCCDCRWLKSGVCEVAGNPVADPGVSFPHDVCDSYAPAPAAAPGKDGGRDG